MPIKPSQLIWHNGDFVPWEKATVHVLAHGLHYGSSVFEGIRAYRTPEGTAVFRLRDHLRRLYDSARIYRMEIPYAIDVLAEMCRDVLRVNGLSDAYIRPVAYRGYGTLGLVAGNDASVEVAVAAVEWGSYLGAESLERGVDVGVSSWMRLAPNTMPALAKAGGNYLSSQLVAMEAKRHGYVEGIALDDRGHISEGSGENLFLLREGVLYTPPVTSSILLGLTRDTVIALARHLGHHVREQALPRESLYLADEIFLTGTAAEIVPVRSVDGLTVGDGRRGPVTAALQRAFFGLFTGETQDRWGWLDRVTPRLETGFVGAVA
ncbi:MAG: branched-chain-amino-acid transaminase [Planctomycetes bacterium]|nr:branched-chain-amino-acid transaminase [Planctomycetota bacterium]